ncbi:hypothetical protein ACJMK2_013971 [Sinanodonta woodiana]|uniref:Mitogen-activated protein kinase kinase kinase 2 n=1 Tax=Sinanodonta woodiana TaxID=1069815 RepID=A0ABD3V281_SINWO
MPQSQILYDITGSGKRFYLMTRENSQSLRVKCEFNGERRSINISRPVTYEHLRCKISEMYSCELNMFFTQPNGEVYAPILSQSDLDTAVNLVDNNDRITSLRIFLTSPNDGGPGYGKKRHGMSVTDPHRSNIRDSPSPPPGSLPPHESTFRQSLSRTSVNSEGEFIPEGETDHGLGSMSDSLSSLESGGPNTFPLRIRRDSRRSILSDSAKDEIDNKVRFGTFPRNFESGGHTANVEGHRTFPRANIMNRRPDTGSNALRSIMSRGSEGTLSTSSSSSGLPPDPEDSPEGRLMMYKRNSDHESPVFSISDLAFSKSPRAPTNWTRGRSLGSGAFGEVYLCYDRDSGRELAVKQVQLIHMNAETSKEVRALENEIQLLRNFEHERIVQYFGCHQDEMVLSIFMEYMPGGSVKDELTRYGPLMESVGRKYTRQVLEGLAYLHKNVIVHRDIKGANILRDSHGNVKLADFGACKRLQTICSATGCNTIVGTPYWMAPEIINGENYGRKADVWSLGCTVVEMMTLKPPWAEFETMAAIYKIATEEPRYELPRNASNDLRNFLYLTFRKNPQERPTAEDMLRHPFTNG